MFDKLSVLAVVIMLSFSLGAGGGCKKEESSTGSKEKKEVTSEEKVASCNNQGLSSCREYRGANLALGTEGLKKLCDAVKGTFGEVACPVDKAIGSCKVPEHKDFYYEGYTISMGEAEKECKDRQGTFTPIK
jgi:hypothetical protein